MRPAAKFCLLLAVSALTAFSIRSLMAQDAESQVKREVERLQRSLKEKPITDPDFAPVNNMAADGLKSAADALNNGQLYVSLERLNSASSLLQGARTGEEKADAVKSGLPAFETEWGKASLQLTSLDQNARKQDWSKSPLAIRALAEAAQGRSIPLLDGSRGFATSTKPKDGLFYMGQAQARGRVRKVLCFSPGPAQARISHVALVPARVTKTSGKDECRVPAAQIDRPALAFHRTEFCVETGTGTRLVKILCRSSL